MISSIRQQFEENDRLSPFLSLEHEYEEVTETLISPTLLANEQQCANKRWFDVRDLHPLAATAYFAECFMVQHANVTLCRGRSDYKSAPFRSGIKRVLLIEQSKTTLSGLWKARQTADMLSCPYDYFVFNLQLIAEKRGRRHLLRPCQLYQKELIEIFTEQWNKRINTKLLFSEDPHFTEQAFIDNPIQREHRNFVAAQITLRAAPLNIRLLASAVYNHHLFSVDYATQRFPDLMDAATKWADQLGWRTE